MTFLRILLLVLLALVLVLIALANREAVDVALLPDQIGDILGFNLRAGGIPLFGVIFCSIAFGLVIGFVAEWLREHKHRAEAARERSRREKLERKVSRVEAANSERDDVLAIVDGPR
ncbi:LapA family protein [Jannaschia sp. Os4]|uniref:LapA family protein n=1 Tax=Jannaschia sp. Os4 TaxID=2807617 RepID=UPI00193A4030|nr:LapA family protein [Jannaschia sp. Os4]MBM2577571.1 LapA family protein [Jannaschia sp. Os4]